MIWNSSILWGIIGLIGGALTSLFFYSIGKKRKKISYYITTTTLVSCNATQINDLNIQYKEKPIQDLYTSTITFRNIGNCIIETSDFALSAPLSLITDGEFLINRDLDTQMTTKDAPNQVSLHMEMADGACKKSIIQFDYIPKKERMSFNVFHTGEIQVSGQLKDGKIINITGAMEKNDEEQIITLSILGIIEGIAILLLLFQQTFG